VNSSTTTAGTVVRMIDVFLLGATSAQRDLGVA
jgi:hypothetical protein